MNYNFLKDKLSQADIAILTDIEDRLAKKELHAMEEWATFFAFDHPELVTDDIATKVVQFYQQAIAHGISRAMLNLGALYYNGVFVPQDFEKAVHLYHQAANSDDATVAVRAICNLGYCYYYGRSIAVDKEKAFFYFLKGTLKYEDPNCMYKLGDMYRRGECVEKDEKMAYALYEKAYEICSCLDESLADILVRLGECELHGIGIERDILSSLRRLTAAEGHLYEKIYVKKDPFAQDVLAKVKRLIRTAEDMLQED